jgi:4'-phosphopantetheinyl transferase
MTPGSIFVAYSGVDELPSSTLAYLSQSDIQRAGEFKAPRRRQQFLCARVLLRTVLERITGVRATSHKLTTNENGKPVIVNGPSVSIAHSGDTVICAVTDQGDIGIDIEVPGRRRNTKGIADNYFAEDEAAWLATQPNDRFYMLWVLKEAWLKATGSGLAGGLDSLSCIVTPPDIVARIVDHELKGLSLYSADDALIGLATTKATHEKIVINQWDCRSGRFEPNSGARLIAATYQPTR